jgi:hypothetical protein
VSEPLEYVAAHLNEALANDPRVSELGLHIAVRGDRLYVTGTVATDERRTAIEDVLAGLGTGYEIHNETTVACMAVPDDVETLT